MQDTLENSSLDLVEQISRKYRSYSDFSPEDIQDISDTLNSNAIQIRDRYLSFFFETMFRYSDGWINSWNRDTFSSVNTGYPAWWLEAVGYQDGPPPVDVSLKKVMLTKQNGEGDRIIIATKECIKQCALNDLLTTSDSIKLCCESC